MKSGGCLHFLKSAVCLHIGHKRRLGLIGAKRTTITVHRSEEILPAEGSGVPKPSMIRGTSVSSEGDLANAELAEQAGDDR